MPLFGDRGSVRDALLFAALGLLPAGAIAAVGLRALDGEAAAVRGEAAQLVDGAARDLERSVTRSLEEAASELAALRLEETLEGEGALRAELARVHAPHAAELVVLGFPAAKAVEAVVGREGADTCLALGRDMVRTGDVGPFGERCREVRDGSGRWLFPVFASAPPLAPLASALGPWMSEHGAALGVPERAALERDARAVTDPIKRAALEQALRATPKGVTSVAARRAAEAGARRWPDARGLVEWSEGGSRGVLRVLDRTRSFGFAIHRASLEGALATGGLLPPDVAWAWDVSGASAIRASATVAPGLVVIVSHARTDRVESRALQKRWIVGSLLGGATLVVLVLGSLVFLRVRQMRRTSELRTDFVAAVSHELRTPIGSVRMLAELLEQGRVEEDERAEVHQALARETRRLSDTVERLLELRRMLAGRHEAKLEADDVALVVEGAVDAFEAQWPDAVRVERALEHVTMPVDRSLLRLAVDNLLTNARKYAPDGTPYEVRVERRASGRGRSVVITVTDHGPGIAPRDQARIFAPFERADDRLSRATEGFGIGLALVRWAATQHGGEASVSSAPSRGASFSISIPISSDHARGGRG